MKIIWNPNPLLSEVYLDADDYFWFKEKIRVNKLVWKLHDVEFSLNGCLYNDEQPKEQYSREAGIQRALEASKVDREALDQEVEKWFEIYMDALTDIHIGDCTCVPCSCMKCHAESVLGIDTIEGLGKHEASKIAYAFGNWVDGDTEYNIQEVLENLKSYKPENQNYDNWGDMDPSPHFNRWRQEAKNAHEWLFNYAQTHGFS